MEELESVVAAEAIGSASEFALMALEAGVSLALARPSVAVLEMQASPELVAVGLDDVVVTGASILSASAAFAVTES